MNYQTNLFYRWSLIFVCFGLFFWSVSNGNVMSQQTQVRPQTDSTQIQNDPTIPIIDEIPKFYDLKNGPDIEINIPAGQFVRILVQQKDIDVVVEVFGPDNQLVQKMDSPTGTRGTEEVQFISALPGRYKVHLQVLEEFNHQGTLKIWREPFRTPSPMDIDTAQAHDFLSKGLYCPDAPSKCSIENYNKALAIFEKNHCLERIAYTNFLIGDAFMGLYKQQRNKGQSEQLDNHLPQALMNFKTAYSEWEKLGRNVSLQ